MGIMPLGETCEMALDPIQMVADVVGRGDQYISVGHSSASPARTSARVSVSVESPMSQALRG